MSLQPALIDHFKDQESHAMYILPTHLMHNNYTYSLCGVAVSDTPVLATEEVRPVRAVETNSGGSGCLEPRYCSKH